MEHYQKDCNRVGKDLTVVFKKGYTLALVDPEGCCFVGIEDIDIVTDRPRDFGRVSVYPIEYDIKWRKNGKTYVPTMYNGWVEESESKESVFVTP